MDSNPTTTSWNSSEQSPSKRDLTYRGGKFAEVSFQLEGDPLAIAIRIPRESFQIPGMLEQLTMDNLLKALAIAPEQVDSWRHGELSYSSTDSGLGDPLPPLPEGTAQLDIYFRLKSPLVVDNEQGNLEKKWQDLDLRWKAILGLEATVDTLRINMEGLLTEMEGSLRRSLTPEDKVYALRADLAQWNKAKSRVHFALPKVKEFIHRAIWSLGAPERKQLDEIYKNHIQPQVPWPEMDRVLHQLEILQKNRQVLSAHGTTVYQDCKSIALDVQTALRTLQTNAARAQQKTAKSGKSKFFKDIRRLSGLNE